MIRFVTNGTIGVSPGGSIYAVLPIRLSVQVTSLSRSQAVGYREAAQDDGLFCSTQNDSSFSCFTLEFFVFFAILIRKEMRILFQVFQILGDIT